MKKITSPVKTIFPKIQRKNFLTKGLLSIATLASITGVLYIKARFLISFHQEIFNIILNASKISSYLYSFNYIQIPFFFIFIALIIFAVRVKYFKRADA